MEIIILTIAAFVTAILTFFSGFGLGTIMLPLFALFFPIDQAIAYTGIVHFFNNLFKVILVGRNADVPVLIRFGIPAVVAAFIGAYLLINITDLQPLFTYSISMRSFEVTPVEFLIAILMILFGVIELLPFFDRLQFDRSKLPLGGLLSGFFGGLSGHQGALRSAFLIRAGLSKEAFIGSAVVISCFVDFTRLTVYATRFISAELQTNLDLVLASTGAAILGAYMGNKMLKKITLKFIQRLVAIMLIIISIALAAGVI